MGAEAVGMEYLATTAVLAVADLATDCQSTSGRSASLDTEFTVPPMRKLVVAGSGNWEFCSSEKHVITRYSASTNNPSR